MELPKISRTTLVDKIVEILYEKIIKGDLKPGEKLPGEIELSSQMGISRPTIREALSYLTGLGLIVRGDLGMYVANEPTALVQSSLSSLILDNWETKNLYEARRVLEGEIAALAAQRANSDDVDELIRLNNIVAEKLHDGQEYWDADVAFHLKIAKIADNDILYSMTKIIYDLYDKFEKNILKQKKIIESTPINHLRLIEAIKEGDSSKARELIHFRLENAEEDMIELRIKEKIEN